MYCSVVYAGITSRNPQKFKENDNVKSKYFCNYSTVKTHSYISIQMKSD